MSYFIDYSKNNGNDNPTNIIEPESYYSEILNNNKYDLSLPPKDFNKKYSLKFFVKYENTKSMLCLILGRIEITLNYNKYLDLFFNTIKNIDDEIELILINIINHNSLTSLKYIETKYSLIYVYNSQYCNIVNYCLEKSNSIFRYIFENNNINLMFNLAKHNLYIDGNLDNNKYLIDHIINNYEIIKNKEFYSGYFKSFITNNFKKNFSIIKYFVYNINEISVFNYYLENCIYNLYIIETKELFEKRTLLVNNLDYKNILNKLYLICNNKLNGEYHSFNFISIIDLWKYLFPLVEKFVDEYDITDFFWNNPLNIILAIKNGKKIVKLIEKYVISWNEPDECEFTPIMDCFKYGTLDTIRYMVNKYELEFNNLSFHNENIFTCVVFNSNIKVLEYFIKFINLNLDSELIKEITNYKHIFSNINILNNNHFYKKIHIICDLQNENDKILFINQIINKNLDNKELITELIIKYNFKIDINNYSYDYLNCNNIDLTYLKLVIDNLNLSNLKKNILYILGYGCFTKIKDLINYYLLKYNHTNIDFHNDFYNTFYLITNGYNFINNNNFCCNNTYLDYLKFIKKKIFLDKVCYYDYQYTSDIDKYNESILDYLFKNGIFPSSICELNFNNNLRNLIHAKNKRYNKKTYFNKWYIVIIVLKKYIKNKFEKNKNSYKLKIRNVNTQFNFNPSIIFKSIKPTHITPLDLYKNINETHLYISQKADGLYKKGLFNIYPKFDNCNLDELEYEFVKKDNICYVFNSLENDCEDSIMILRDQHKFVPKIIYPPLNLNNYKRVLEEYKKNESEAVNIFINQNKKIKKWWPKYIFKIENMDKSSYINLLNEITKLNLDIIPTDGWILINTNNILKIKPKPLLTIDLIYRENNLFDANNNTYNFFTTLNLINNKIYRCYFNEIEKYWEPRDLRFDKFKPNNSEICRFIELSHLYPWSLSDFTLNDIYYQKNNFYNNYCKKNINFKNINFNETILDLGCGFGHINNCNYVGLDIDPKILINKNNKNIYICDINKDWNLPSQIDTYNNIYYYLPNILDFKQKYANTKFDNIISINSIHYFINSNCNKTSFFKKMNQYCRKKTKFIIRFLDKNLLDRLLKSNYISNGSSFVRKIPSSNNNYKIKIYYDWTHNKPIEEEVFSMEMISELFKNNGWEFYDYNHNSLDKELSEWDRYFECFSTLVFIKK